MMNDYKHITPGLSAKRRRRQAIMAWVFTGAWFTGLAVAVGYAVGAIWNIL